MVGKIKVNTSCMKADIDQMAKSIKNMSDSRSELLEKKEQLDSMWDGPASEEFKNAFQDDLEALYVMISNMQRIFNYEKMAKECYENCENQVSGVIADI